MAYIVFCDNACQIFYTLSISKIYIYIMFTVKKTIWDIFTKGMLLEAFNALCLYSSDTIQRVFFIIKIIQSENITGLVFPLSLIADTRELI